MDLERLKGHVITTKDFLIKYGKDPKLESSDSTWSDTDFLSDFNLTSHSKFSI